MGFLADSGMGENGCVEAQIVTLQFFLGFEKQPANPNSL
jgi:hypothetical protein